MDKNLVNPYDAGTATPFPEMAKIAVVQYYNARAAALWDDLNRAPKWIEDIAIGDVYVVWFAKTLQNWKALVSTTVEDGRYYEVTYNGDKNETYIDVYEKQDNLKIEGVPEA